MPPFHRDDTQLAFERLLVALLSTVEAFLIDQGSQFSDRESIYVGNLELADE